MHLSYIELIAWLKQGSNHMVNQFATEQEKN